MSQSTIHDFYEKLLEEASFDLHERYSQLLSALQWKANEEDASLISYIIEDMRERSSCYSPVTLKHSGAFRAWKSYARQLGKRNGVHLEFQEASFHEWQEGDPLLFRFLQQMIQFIVAEEAPEVIKVSVEGETLLLFYKRKTEPVVKKVFPEDFANVAGVSIAVQEGKSVLWTLKRKDARNDINSSCG